MNNWGLDREVEKSKPGRQVSIESLPPSQQDQAMHETEVATRDYPAVELASGCSLHVFEMPAGGGSWDVWLNTADATFTGVCVAVGMGRDEAVANAVQVLEEALAKLQEPTHGTLLRRDR
jgi:hypothetical protein